MKVDLENDVLLTLREVSARLPGRPNLSTLHRWRLNGVRGRKLPTALIGGRRYVALSALQAFVDGQSVEAPPEGTPSAQRQRQIAAADAILAKAGI